MEIKRKLAVARLWFEGNAFAPVSTGREAFRAREWTSGEAALAAARGTETELAAVADLGGDWAVTCLRCASAMPGGPIDDAVFDDFLDQVVEDLRRETWDAVYLSLHGAAITRFRGAPEVELVEAVRAAAGNAPVAATFDLHANLDPRLAELLTVASGYRTHPHVDMRQTAARVLALLDRTVRGEIRPRGAIVATGLLLPSFNMRTESGPMARLQASARAAERSPILDLSVFGGFPYADAPACGASVMAWADGDGEAANRAAEELAEQLRAAAPEFAPRLLAPTEGLRRALAAPPGLVAVTDPADNPYSGGAADTPGLLRALLALSPRIAVLFAYFCDADVVDTCWRAGVGAHVLCLLGGKRSGDFGPPVEVEGEVVRLTRGEFVNEGPMERGVTVALGRTAMIRVRDIWLIVTERIAPADDPAFYALHGVDLNRVRLLCVKAKNHFRAAFAARCVEIIDVDCPGPAAADLSSLPFRNIDPRLVR